ncbi:GNAT family N-acetyltransferase [Pirellulaceae bacterium SH501]
MTTQIAIRRAGADDYGSIADVMFDAVRHGRSNYSEEQRKAWGPHLRTGPDWIARLNSQSIFVAELSGQISGFMSLADNGYIDFAFIRPSAQGTGMFRRLYQAIEDLAIQTGETRLWVHASLMAQPAFTAVGFRTTEKETVEINGQLLQRFAMEKQLGITESDDSNQLPT